MLCEMLQVLRNKEIFLQTMVQIVPKNLKNCKPSMKTCAFGS